jgi:hypothetical protein
MMANDYTQHVVALHDRFEAPAELIATAAKDRIVYGEANEV